MYNELNICCRSSRRSVLCTVCVVCIVYCVCCVYCVLWCFNAAFPIDLFPPEFCDAVVTLCFIT